MPKVRKDPLEKLAKKMEGRNLKFSLRKETQKQVEKAMKKSVSKDGLSQDKLMMGSEFLSIPLTRMINNSIENGEVQIFGRKPMLPRFLRRRTGPKMLC